MPADCFPMGRSDKRHSSVCWYCTEEEAYAREALKAKRRATWPDPASGRLVRRCFTCHEVKDLERDFGSLRLKKHPEWHHGKDRRCKVCRYREVRAREKTPAGKARRRMLVRRYQARHPDRVKARAKRYWQKVKNNPVRHAQINEDARMRKRLRREREGKIPVERKGSARLRQPKARSYLPVGPLLELVEGFIDRRRKEGSPETDSCRELRVDPRTVRAWRSGQYQSVRLGKADSIAVAAGTHISVVYPPEQFPALYA